MQPLLHNNDYSPTPPPLPKEEGGGHRIHWRGWWKAFGGFKINDFGVFWFRTILASIFEIAQFMFEFFFGDVSPQESWKGRFTLTYMHSKNIPHF